MADAGPNDLERQVAALEQGRAFLDLAGWNLTEVGGSDAEGWLNDLVTARVDALEAGRSVRSFLLSPTGRIRADLRVVRSATRANLVLLQGPGQPFAIADLLGPYVLSSDVALEPTSATGLFVIPSADDAWLVAESLPSSNRLDATADAYETWRIRRGIPAFPADLDEDSLPAEAGLDAPPVIDRDKGCYLGQESVARVRNLGHPPRVVVAVGAGGPIARGDGVVADGEPVGVITSVDASSGTALARVRWGAERSTLASAAGTPLSQR